MITIDKLKMYDSYKGSIDNFGHAPSRDRKVISDSEFSIIEVQNPDIQTTLFRRKMISESAGERLPTINL